MPRGRAKGAGTRRATPSVDAPLTTKSANGEDDPLRGTWVAAMMRQFAAQPVRPFFGAEALRRAALRHMTAIADVLAIEARIRPKESRDFVNCWRNRDEAACRLRLDRESRCTGWRGIPVPIHVRSWCPGCPGAFDVRRLPPLPATLMASSYRRWLKTGDMSVRVRVDGPLFFDLALRGPWRHTHKLRQSDRILGLLGELVHLRTHLVEMRRRQGRRPQQDNEDRVSTLMMIMLWESGYKIDPRDAVEQVIARGQRQRLWGRSTAYKLRASASKKLRSEMEAILRGTD